MKKIFGLAFGLIFASTGLAGAQVVTEVRTISPPAIGANSGWRMSHLMGSTVQLQGVNNFGKVEDAVIGPDGRISYVVVSNNGRNLMLPWSEGTFRSGERIMVYNVAPAAVAPLYFETGAWPNVWEPGYTTRVRRVFPGFGGYRHEVLRPVGPGVVPPGGVVPPAGVIEQKVKVKPNGKVKIKERDY